jgi:hypothetical protein
MKRSILCLFVLFHPLFSNAQQLAGAYLNGSFNWNVKAQCNQKNASGRERPESLIGSVLWAKGDTLLLFGGAVKAAGNMYTDFKMSNRIWMYQSGEWSFYNGNTGYVSGWGSPDYDGTSTYNYGQTGVASPSNWPGARVNAAYTSDESGNLYMYGGYGLGNNGSGSNVDVLEDLWLFDGTHWTSLMNGISTLNANHGTKGVSSASNSPGGRVGATLWYANNSLYLFGGAIFQSVPYSHDLQPLNNFNDLWQFDFATQQWTWISGSSSGNTGASSSGGQYTYPQSLSESASCLDENGNLYLYGGYSSPGGTHQSNSFWKFDGSNWTLLSGDPDNPNNANGSLPGALAGAQLSAMNGKIYLIGGGGTSSSTYVWNGSNWSLHKSCSNSNGTLQAAYDADACPGELISFSASCRWNGESYFYGGTGGSNWDYSSGLYKFNGQNFAVEFSAGKNQFNYQLKNSANISFPGGLNRAAWAFDESSQSLYLYGGDSYDPGYHSNLWQYQNGEWIWLTGAGASSSTASVHGSLGIPAATNTPGSRMDAVMWIGSGDTLWLFGGYGFDENGALGRLNDLFCYVEGEWIWMKGSKFRNDAGSFGSQGLSSPNNNPPGLSGMKVWTNPQGEAYLFGGLSSASTTAYHNAIWKFDGQNWTWIKGDNSPGTAAVFGTKGIAQPTNNPGGSFNFTLAGDDNGFYIYGGATYYSHRSSSHFSNQLWYFDAASENWTFLFGSTLGASNVPGFDSISKNSNAVNPGYNRGGASWVANGKFYLFSGLIYTGLASHYYTPSNNLWEWNGSNWSWLKGAQDLEGADPNLAQYGDSKSFDYDYLPAPRYYPVYWKNGNSLYLAKGLVTAAGMSSQNLDDVWAFHPGNIWDGSDWTNGKPLSPLENVQIQSNLNPSLEVYAKSLWIDADLNANLSGQNLHLTGNLYQYGWLSDLNQIYFEGNGDQHLLGKTLNVDDICFVSANTTLHTNNLLQIKASGPSQYGQLVNLGTIEDSVAFEFYINLSAAANNGRYIHLGSIFENAQLSILQEQAEGIVGLDFSGANAGKNTVWKWNSQQGVWESPSSTEAFAPGASYALYAGSNPAGDFLTKNGDAGVLRLKGLIPNQSTISKALNYHDGQGSSSSFSGGTALSATEGWNHISNPFPFSVKIKDLLAGMTNKTVYLWDGNSYATYNTLTDVYTNNGSSYIAPGQGFYVQLASADVGTISQFNFPKEQLWNSTNGIKGAFYKAKAPLDGLRIELLGEDSLQVIEDLWLGFDILASSHYDGQFDAWKIMDYSAKSYILSEGDAYSVSTVNPDSCKYVDLGFTQRLIQGDSLNLNLKMADLKSFKDFEIEDLKTGHRQRISSDFRFNFVYDSLVNPRIRLHFNQGLGLSKTPSYKADHFGFYNSSGDCYLKCFKAAIYPQNLIVEIYRPNGQLVEKLDWSDAQQDQIILKDKSPGLYIANITNQEGQVIFQVKVFHEFR